MELQKCKACDKELPLQVGFDNVDCVFCGALNITKPVKRSVDINASEKKNAKKRFGKDTFSDVVSNVTTNLLGD